MSAVLVDGLPTRWRVDGGAVPHLARAEELSALPWDFRAG
jgi:hypothetical protein